MKNRIRFRLVPDDQQAEVDRLVSLGARDVDIGQGRRRLGGARRSRRQRVFCILAAR